MTIILFLIDTSGSMNQRAHSGAKPTLLDITKETVERFIKIRQRDVASRGDRYMLLTFDEVPHNIKAGWKETHNVFINELKNLTATGLTTINSALKNSFDYLNINRMQTGIDTYGMGRCPYYLESAIIILITDGSKYLTSNNVQEELIIPASHCPGSEFTIEPYRWDQRLFSIVLRLSGIYKSDQSNGVTSVPCDNSPINSLCETTGGRSFCVTSKNEINWSLEYVVSRMHNGVMVKFEKFGPDPPMIPSNNGGGDEQETKNNHFDQSNNRSWQNTRNMIFVRPSQKGYSVGNWPIPESYWPDPNIPNLQARSAHPVIRFTCTNSEPTVIDNLPFDKYELDSSPLTNFILARKQPNVAWQVFVANSQRNSEFGQPFGYLKASTNLTCVNLFVLPYNYPMLLPLLDELIKQLQGKPTREWRQQFDNYLKGMPLYYAPPLRRALQRMNSNPNLIPDSLDMYANVNLNNIIKKQKSIAKIEFDKLTSSMGQHKPVNIEWPRISTNHFSLMYHNRKTTAELYCSNPSLKRTFSLRPYEFQDFNGFTVRYKDKPNSEYKASFYRNPADIPRHELLNQASKLRQIFFQKQISLIKYLEEDQMFNLPVSQMGNYQEYLKKKPPPLREIEAAPTRQHMFGNPFKLDKKNLMMIDEADIDLVAGGGGSNQSPRGMKRSMSPDSFGAPKPKRKPGPLPKDYSYLRSRSPSPSHLMYNQNQTPPPSSPSSPYIVQHGPPPTGVGGQPQNIYYGNYHTNSMFNNTTSQPNMVNHQKLIYPNANASNHIKISQNNNSNKYMSSAMHPGIQNNNIVSQVANSHHTKVITIGDTSTNDNFNKLIGFNPIVNNHDQPQNFQKLNRPLPINSKSTSPVVSITNGNTPFSSINIASTFPKLNSAQQMINGGMHGKTNTFLDPQKAVILTKEETEKVKIVLHYVRIKDQKTLLQILSSHKGLFGDYLLYQAVSYAQRFGMKQLIQLLSNHFGPKVHKALEPNLSNPIKNKESKKTIT